VKDAVKSRKLQEGDQMASDFQYPGKQASLGRLRRGCLRFGVIAGAVSAGMALSATRRYESVRAGTQIAPQSPALRVTHLGYQTRKTIKYGDNSKLKIKDLQTTFQSSRKSGR
jgi:hypothetical protein